MKWCLLLLFVVILFLFVVFLIVYVEDGELEIIVVIGDFKKESI